MPSLLLFSNPSHLPTHPVLCFLSCNLFLKKKSIKAHEKDQNKHKLDKTKIDKTEQNEAKYTQQIIQNKKTWDSFGVG